MSLLDDNPFLVLGLTPAASRAEVEREGQELLGMLELGVRAAATYATALGRRTRSADLVRQAMADLRDPDRRVVAETAFAPPLHDGPPHAPPPWADARACLGWRKPSSR